MKTAIYIEDGVIQLVITPETEFEKDSLSTFRDKPLSAEIFSGSFYDCRGGWVRQKPFYQERNIYANYGDSNDRSLILRMDKEKE